MSKKIWGPITWELFHVMGENLNTLNYNEIQDSVNIIVLICNNLPCPDCSREAMSKIKKYNLKFIRTKEDVKLFIFYLHNSVNETLNKVIYNENELHIYKNKNINIKLNNFFNVYNKIKGSNNLIMFSFHRNTMLKNTRNYFLKNIHLYTN